jgi:hypothetical protein
VETWRKMREEKNGMERERGETDHGRNGEHDPHGFQICRQDFEGNR